MTGRRSTSIKEKVFNQLIEPEESIEALKDIINLLGMGFHPDTLASEYVNSTGKTFTEEEAMWLDKNLDIMHATLNNIYEEVITIWQELCLKEKEANI